MLELVGLSLIVDLIFRQFNSPTILNKLTKYISLSQTELLLVASLSILLKVFLQLFIRYISISYSSRIQFNLRNTVIKRYILNDIHETNSIPNQKMINILNENINRYSSIYASSVQLISHLVSFIFYTCLLFLISIKLTLIYLFIIILFLPLFFKINKISYSTGHIFLESLDMLQKKILEVINKKTLFYFKFKKNKFR